MNNPYKPALSPERQELLTHFRDSCEEMGPYTTREKSLYVMLDQFPSLIERLEKKNIKGKELYQQLHFKYTQNDLSQERPRHAFTDDYDTADSWKPKPDVEFTSMLSVQLARADLTTDEALYNAFIKGANSTESGNALSTASNSMQIERTAILKEYLFTSSWSVLGNETKALLSPLETSEQKDLATQKDWKSKVSSKFRSIKAKTPGRLLLWVGLYASIHMCTEFVKDKKEAKELKEQAKVTAADTTKPAQAKATAPAPQKPVAAADTTKPEKEASFIDKVKKLIP